MTDDKGGAPTQYPLEAFKEAVETLDEMVGTQDVADEIGCSYELAYKRLHHLEENGEIGKKRVANTIIWTAENNQ